MHRQADLIDLSACDHAQAGRLNRNRLEREKLLTRKTYQLDLLEIALGHSADWASPVIRQRLERGSGRLAVVGISNFWVINIAADCAYILVHIIHSFCFFCDLTVFLIVILIVIVIPDIKLQASESPCLRCEFLLLYGILLTSF